MTCPHCGAENDETAKFCNTCGRSLTTEAVSPETPPRPAEEASRSRLAAELRKGWREASVRAALVFLLLVAIGQALAFLDYYGTSGTRDLSISGVIKVGALYLSVFHHAGIVVRAPVLESSLDISLSAALLGVTALAVYLLYLGGRSLANEFGGDPLARALHGLKLAPAYALLSLLVSIVLAVSPIRFDEGSIRSAPVGALLWPLVIAALAGAAGGAMTAKEEIAERWAWGRRGLAAVVAGWRMLIAGLVLSFVGLLVLTIAKPDDSKVYFAGLRNAGEEDGVVAAVHNVLLFPNESVLVLVPAMGACDGVYGGFFSFDLLCYTNFPTEGALPSGAEPTAENPFAGLSGFLPKSGTAPVGYFLFLLVPLVATVWGGRFAARRAGSRGEALALGAAGGVVFAILVAGAAILAGIALGVSGGIGGLGLGGNFGAGPQVATGGLLALLWGAGGGALGAFTVSRSAGAIARPSETPASEAPGDA